LAGKDVWEQARVDELADLFIDVHTAFKPFTYCVSGFEKGDEVINLNSIILLISEPIA
jgi:hypothetical protein